ncbi:hypothetical protein P7K49_030182 [Saguinus oedipus]|uniref:Uncharacterized protein n=1 Tax=Saguinus oedipus TaxID=9490 RepID=A0ABQ9U1F4_SAGOE|nr:hypothetical protein P7K49_030182 [Saguinus oedipus]
MLPAPGEVSPGVVDRVRVHAVPFFKTLRRLSSVSSGKENSHEVGRAPRTRARWPQAERWPRPKAAGGPARSLRASGRGRRENQTRDLEIRLRPYPEISLLRREVFNSPKTVGRGAFPLEASSGCVGAFGCAPPLLRSGLARRARGQTRTTQKSRPPLATYDYQPAFLDGLPLPAPLAFEGGETHGPARAPRLSVASPRSVIGRRRGGEGGFATSLAVGAVSECRPPPSPCPPPVALSCCRPARLHGAAAGAEEEENADVPGPARPRRGASFPHPEPQRAALAEGDGAGLRQGKAAAAATAAAGSPAALGASPAAREAAEEAARRRPVSGARGGWAAAKVEVEEVNGVVGAAGAG